MKTIFDESGYSVKLNFINTPAGFASYREWIVSDGVVSFSLGYEPTLTLEGVKDEVLQYKLEKLDYDLEHGE